MFANGETVTRLRATSATDPYSGESSELSWASPDSLEITNVGIAPGSSTENDGDSRERLDVQFTLYAPFSADVKPLDRVIVRGSTYDVLGAPERWRSPFTGVEHGTVIEVGRVAG